MKVGDLFFILGLKVSDEWKRGAQVVSGLRSALLGLAGLAGGGFLSHLISSTTETATHVVALSQSMGMTIEQTQEWGYVAEQSGSNLKQLSVGIGMAQRQLRTFAQGRGGKQLSATMRELGVSQADAKAALASPAAFDAWLLKTSDRLKAMGNTGERGAVGKGLFGARAGAAVVADMARGSAGILALRKHFRDLGGEVNGDTILHLREFGNKLNDVKVTLRAFATEAVSRAAPMLSKVFESIENWVNNPTNRERAFSFMATAFSVIATIAGVALDVLTFFGDIVTWVAKDPLSVLIGALTVLGYIFGVAGAEAALAWVAILGPLVLIIAAIKIATEIVRALGDVFGAIGDTIEMVEDGIHNAFGAMSDWASMTLDSLGPVGTALRAIKDTLIWIWDHSIGQLAIDSGSGNLAVAIRKIRTDHAAAKTGMDHVNSTSPNGTATVNAAPKKVVNNVTHHHAPTHIRIDAKNADAEEVRRLVAQELEKLKAKEHRHAMAAVGGRGDE